MIWLALAILKVAAGLVSSVLVAWKGEALATALPLPFHAGLLAAFATAGVTLVGVAGRSDSARWLGLVFCLFASIFADSLLRAAAAGSNVWMAISPVLRAITPAALIPLYFWRFVWEFPRRQPALVPAWLPFLIEHITLAAGCAFFVLISVASFSLPGPNPAARWRDLMWTSSVLLLLPSLVLLVVKAWTALPEERRRLKIFIGGLVIGMLPLMLDVLLSSFFSNYRTFVAAQAHTVAKVVATFSLAIPLITAYAVVVERALETRLIVRLAIQYAFARYTVLGIAFVPIIVVGRYVYVNRQQPFSELLMNSSASVWVALLGLVLCIERVRRPLLAAIDRRYFREHPDPARILASVANRARAVTSLEQLATLIANELDEALHVRRVSLLVRHADQFQDPLGTTPPLDTNGPLASLAIGATSAFHIDLVAASSPLHRLPSKEVAWLTDSGARLLVPLAGSQHDVIGLLILGEKRSETPYTPTDEVLLQAVSTAAALGVERQFRGRTPSGSRLGQSLGIAETLEARECDRCGLIFEPTVSICVSCSRPAKSAAVPVLLAGKFQLLCRLGTGGMGVVYKGRDIDLGRLVAIKTLHRLSGPAAERLRREARALAALHHPHLEIIHGVESWRGVPMLVLEFLGGGTLATRLDSGALNIDQVFEVASAVAGGLHALHRVGVLHRDIKPSNIGFTDDGVPKLLDFGLAVVTRPPLPTGTAGQTTTRTATGLQAMLGGQTGFAGTPLYMSPEALAGGKPDVGFDLWGLSMTLLEMVIGRAAVVAHDQLTTEQSLYAGNMPDISKVRPDCPPKLVDLLADALNIDQSKRPQSAREFSRRLQHVRETL